MDLNLRNTKLYQKLFNKAPITKKAKVAVVPEPAKKTSPLKADFKFTKKVKVARKLRKGEKKLLAKTRAGNRKAHNKGRSH